ncbi:MAG TPA: hypothetical protein VFN97_17180 [Actinospica sp.]|nr:hypothetical protein [Actinospica sp.]
MTAPRALDRLSDGAFDWLEHNLEHFDPYSGRAASATHVRAKAVLELALLCSCSARLGDPPGARLAAAAALVHEIWRRPEFLELLDEYPAHADTYSLIYAALAPAGCDLSLRKSALARLSPGFLSPGGKSAYQCLEIRYYADRVGVRHGIDPYPRLIEQSRMTVVPGEARLTLADAYAVTHSGFYLGDFGRNRSALDGDPLARARALVGAILDYSLRHDQWDLAAELVITQYILGIEPLGDARGAAAVRRLSEVQRPDGALPGRSPAEAAPRAASPARFFAAAYHTTLVTALMALIISRGRSA